MLLIHQVELLRQNIMELGTQEFALPLMGGMGDTYKAYRFKSLLLPARDIATTIYEADPSGHKLPPRLRGWNLDIEDSHGNSKRKSLKVLLGMIVHGYYFYVEQNELDVSNDKGDRAIVPYDSFLSCVERLVLPPEDICLVICGLTDVRLGSSQALQALMGDVPGSGDLRHCMATISRWPKLEERIWVRFFADQSSAIDANCLIIDGVPFVQVGMYRGSSVVWKMGWRRGNIYANSFIEVVLLVHEIRDFFSNARPWEAP